MSDIRTVLSRIAALRQRLDETPPLAGSDAPQANALATLPNASETADNPHEDLQRRVAVGERQHAILDTWLRRLPETYSADEPTLPTQLTARARWVLERGRELLSQLRALAVEPALAPDATDPLAERFRTTTAMADSALRMVQTFPDTPSVQLRMCEGLEAILAVVAERVASLRSAVAQRRGQQERISTLAEVLLALQRGPHVPVKPLQQLAEAILIEAQDGAPLQFLHRFPSEPERVPLFVACHSLTVAHVLARLVAHDADWRGRQREAILAALVHDAGMLRIPAELLAQHGALDDDQRRTLESHARAGAELVARLTPTIPGLSDAALSHHERLDGTGYPAGLREAQIPALVRLLTVCDIYASLCTPRPHRPALEPRTALTDTLLLAERGAVDRGYAERLLVLSFYPIGSIVELADGAIGLVVATHMGRRDLSAPARPVIALLTDANGQPEAMPRHLDLAQCDGRTVVRTLPPAEIRQVLGSRYPELTR